jgi:hypothetical protein
LRLLETAKKILVSNSKVLKLSLVSKTQELKSMNRKFLLAQQALSVPKTL